MAKKVRTPPPPKRVVQAPKARTAPRDERRDRKILYAIGASGFLMLAAVVAFLMLAGRGGDGGNEAISTIREAGWTYRNPKDQGRDHVVELEQGFKYNSVPATSGPHSGSTAIYGIYDDPVSEINYLHNLEHGAVGIQYGPRVPEATVARIQEYYREDANGLIVAPNPKLGDQIALTAWTHVAKGKTFDQEVFDTFIEEFGFAGPESCKTDIQEACFRRSDMAPGNP